MRAQTTFLFVLAGACLSTAQLSGIGPFSGTHSEGFESFLNYNENGFSGNVTLPVFGGAGLFTSGSGAQNWIYEPSAGAGWGLIDNGSAPVHGGTQALGLYNFGATVTSTLSFSNDVTAFGGYFNVCANGQDPQELFLSFFDAGSNQIGATQVVANLGNPLVWFGWSSTVGIRSIVMTGGEAPVMDDLEINVVPEPASMAALALGGLALIRRRRK